MRRIIPSRIYRKRGKSKIFISAHSSSQFLFSASLSLFISGVQLVLRGAKSVRVLPPLSFWALIKPEPRGRDGISQSHRSHMPRSLSRSWFRLHYWIQLFPEQPRNAFFLLSSSFSSFHEESRISHKKRKSLTQSQSKRRGRKWKKKLTFDCTCWFWWVRREEFICGMQNKNTSGNSQTARKGDS